eukprot:TRINITY_DN4919_c1_g1_i6.p1 TRINITY_DN4919_c1_g1~~TRINITY_DN4919_c1_g1_i6.p1  ORF type:complete len:175 (+),score=53.81 TRINITY_DN4919_c1_g1_i6:473-997(+)
MRIGLDWIQPNCHSHFIMSRKRKTMEEGNTEGVGMDVESGAAEGEGNKKQKTELKYSDISVLEKGLKTKSGKKKKGKKSKGRNARIGERKWLGGASYEKTNMPTSHLMYLVSEYLKKIQPQTAKPAQIIQALQLEDVTESDLAEQCQTSRKITYGNEKESGRMERETERGRELS